MPSTNLPPELISLVHNIELNKAGWWDKGTQHLILFAVWILGTPAPREVKGMLERDFALEMDDELLQRHISTLCGSGSLLFLNGRLSITESTRNSFEKSIKDFEEIEVRAKARFIYLLRDACPGLDCEETWKLFNQNFLWPLVRDVGARTYQLIAGLSPELPAARGLETFLPLFPPELAEPLSSVAFSFLDPKEIATRSYVLRHLSAHFFVEAGNLSSHTIQALSRIAKQPPAFSIFVDTNFLFSILGLHENPSNEAASMLMRSISGLKAHVKLRLYASPLTLDEAKRSLAFHKDSLRGLNLPRNLAEAAIEDELSGMTRKYLETSSEQSISASDYFAPYLRDLKQVLRDKSVDFYNDPMNSLKTDQAVIDDICAQQEFEQRKSEEAKRQGRRRTPKTYQQLEHDMVLWHFTRRKRPARVESPLDAQYWIVTVDYRLIGFDAFKTHQAHEDIPICVHPTSLIQMLQFWLPRTVEFEEAMIGSLRWPFLIQPFDPEAEKVTIRILQALNRYDGIGDLSKETAGAILINEALRQRLSTESDIENDAQLIRDALLEEHKKAIEEREAARTALDQVENERDGLKIELADSRAQLSISERQKKEAQTNQKYLEERFAEIERQTERQKKHGERQNATRRFALISVLALLVLALGVAMGCFSLRQRYPLWKPATLMGSIAAAIWIWFINFTGMKMPAVIDAPFFKCIRRAKIFVWGTVIVGIIIGTVSILLAGMLSGHP